MVTPLTAEGNIDEPATARLVEHLISGAVHGIFVLGTTGESQSIPASARHVFTRLVGKLIAGRVKYLVGVTETCLEDALSLAATACDAGADGVVAAPPYYYTPSQNDLVRYYSALADASPLPVYLYNMPSRVKVNIDPDTVCRLASHPNIRGLKDSSANMTYFQTVQHLTASEDDFVLFVGPEELTGECVLMGADGGVNGGANMFPELYVAQYEAASAGNIGRVRELQKVVMEISVLLYNLGEGHSSYLQGLKCALSELGICGATLALPYKEFDDAHRAQVTAVLERIRRIWN